MVMRIALAAVLAALLCAPARAGDYGAAPAVARVRTEALRLLARRVRASGADPKTIAVSDVVVAGDRALLSWNSATARGVMGLIVSADRWWDALDMTPTLQPGCWRAQSAYPLAAAQLTAPPSAQTLIARGMSPAFAAAAAEHNADVREARGADCASETPRPRPDLRVHEHGGTIHPPRRKTSGYDFTIAYSANDAGPDSAVVQIYARPPTHAEFAPDHPIPAGWGGPDAVCFFDLTIGGSKPVAFAKGTAIDVWFPFELDDRLTYNLSFFSAGTPSGMIFGTIFDNTLHFVLPPFTMAPGKPLMAEIDGD